jgi:hypothetical protein
MLDIRAIVSLVALSLAVKAAPTEIVVRQGPQPGQSVTNLKFFPSNDLTCDAGGVPYQTKQVFVPQAGTTQTFVVGQCYPQGPYGSIALDFLAGTCKCEFTPFSTPKYS